MLRLQSDLRAMQADPPSVSRRGTCLGLLRTCTHQRHIRRDRLQGCSASPVSDDNLFVWNATIVGPDDSPFEGKALVPLCQLLPRSSQPAILQVAFFSSEYNSRKPIQTSHLESDSFRRCFIPT